jgi:hypothetical protein
MNPPLQTLWPGFIEQTHENACTPKKSSIRGGGGGGGLQTEFPHIYSAGTFKMQHFYGLSSVIPTTSMQRNVVHCYARTTFALDSKFLHAHTGLGRIYPCHGRQVPHRRRLRHCLPLHRRALSHPCQVPLTLFCSVANSWQDFRPVPLNCGHWKNSGY